MSEKDQLEKIDLDLLAEKWKVEEPRGLKV